MFGSRALLLPSSNTHPASPANLGKPASSGWGNWGYQLWQNCGALAILLVMIANKNGKWINMNEHGRFGFNMWRFTEHYDASSWIQKGTVSFQSIWCRAILGCLRYHETWWEMPWSKMGNSEKPKLWICHGTIFDELPEGSSPLNSPTIFIRKSKNQQYIYSNLPMFGCQQNNHNLCLVQDFIDLLKWSPSWLISTVVLPIISYSISLGLPLPSLHLLSPCHVVSAAPKKIRGPPAQRPGRTSPGPPSAARLCRKEGSIWSQTHRSPGRPLNVGGCGCGWVGRWKASFLGITGGVGQIPYWDNYSMCHCQ